MEKIIKQIIAGLDRNLSLTRDQREIAEYALYSVLMTAGTLLGVLAAGAIAGVLAEAIVALFTGAVFRWSTGGAHFSRPGRCMIVSIAVPLVAALASRGLGVRFLTSGASWALIAPTVVLFLLSAAAIHAYAPAETENKPIPANQRPRLRAWAYVTLAGWTGVVYFFYMRGSPSLIVASCLGLGWQMLSVTPVGYKVFHKIDTVLGAFEITLRRSESE